MEGAVRWDRWMEKIGSFGLHLIRLRDQATAHEFILYIDGQVAGFRPLFDSLRNRLDDADDTK